MYDQVAAISFYFQLMPFYLWMFGKYERAASCIEQKKNATSAQGTKGRVALSGRRFESTSEVIATLQTYGDAKDRYATQEEVLQQRTMSYTCERWHYLCFEIVHYIYKYFILHVYFTDLKLRNPNSIVTFARIPALVVSLLIRHFAVSL